MTMIRVLKSHDSSDGSWRTGDIYDADSDLADEKVANGVAEELDAGEIADYEERDFNQEVSDADDAVDSAADDESGARDDLRDAKTARAEARRADIAARSDQRHAVRAQTLGDITAPTGYAAAFHDAEYTKGTDDNAVRIDVTGAETGAAYAGTISSSGGGTPVAFSGTCSGASFNFTKDCSGLNAGTLTVSLRLTDTHNNQGAAVTDTATLNPSA